MRTLIFTLLACFCILATGCNDTLDPLPSTNQPTGATGPAKATLTSTYYAGRNSSGSCLLRVYEETGIVLGEFRPGSGPLLSFSGRVAPDGTMSGTVVGGPAFDGVASRTRASFWEVPGIRCDLSPISPPFGSQLMKGQMTIQTFVPSMDYDGPVPILRKSDVTITDEFGRLTFAILDDERIFMILLPSQESSGTNVDDFNLVYKDGGDNWVAFQSPVSYQLQKTAQGWQLTFDAQSLHLDPFGSTTGNARGTFHLAATIQTQP